jgi:hypothetical protein
MMLILACFLRQAAKSFLSRTFYCNQSFLLLLFLLWLSLKYPLVCLNEGGTAVVVFTADARDRVVGNKVSRPDDSEG